MVHGSPGTFRCESNLALRSFPGKDMSADSSVTDGKATEAIIALRYWVRARATREID